MEPESVNLEFTTDWFENNLAIWESIIDTFKPMNILEIGSFEGRSTCFFARQASKHGEVVIHCVDTWEGGVEHEGIDFTEVEKRFNKNINTTLERDIKNKVTVFKHKGKSIETLANLMIRNTQFDLIYIDGSHDSCDVIADAVMSWKMLVVGGFMVFDDYNNPNPEDDPRFPKLAIDSFLKIFEGRWRKIELIHAEQNKPLEEVVEGGKLYQLYIQKIHPY